MKHLVLTSTKEKFKVSNSLYNFLTETDRKGKLESPRNKFSDLQDLKFCICLNFCTIDETIDTFTDLDADSNILFKKLNIKQRIGNQFPEDMELINNLY